MRLIAARGGGPDSGSQVVFAGFHKVIRSVLDNPESEMLVCSMSPGYTDKDAVENTLVSEKAEVEEFVRFYE